MVVEQEAATMPMWNMTRWQWFPWVQSSFFWAKWPGINDSPNEGTTQRGLTDQEDLEQASWLGRILKNRSENMMIVDLLRNDMNRISGGGWACGASVSSGAVFDRLADDFNHQESVTTGCWASWNLPFALSMWFHNGSTEIATMEIIKNLEPQPRGVYCGTIGLLLPNGRQIFNVAIRTIQLHQGKPSMGLAEDYLG